MFVYFSGGKHIIPIINDRAPLQGFEIMPRTALYPGSFDPVSYGHLDLIKRATKIYDKVIVAVATNSHKRPLFSAQERMTMLREALQEFERVDVVSFDGLVVDFARQHQIKVLLRGLRMVSDFEYEFRLALTNRRMADDIETVFLMPSEQYSFLSSTLLKELASMGADISGFVPVCVEQRLKERLRR